MSFSLIRFAPRALRLEGVGPFQDKPASLDFTTRAGEICNLFLIVGVNGLGKTTLLDSIVWLVELLEVELPSRVVLPDWLRDHPSARMQLDVELELVQAGERLRGLLTLAAAWSPPEELETRDALILRWEDEALEAQGYRFGLAWGFARGRLGLARDLSLARGVDGLPDDAARAVLDNLRALLSVARGEDWAAAPAGEGAGSAMRPFAPLQGRPETAPSVLYFTASRDYMPRVPDQKRALRRGADWGWRLTRCFDGEDGAWQGSLDQFLVQLDYVDERRGRLGLVQQIVNRHVFFESGKVLEGVDRAAMAAMVRVPGGHTHRLDRLSSGERSLAQLFVRAAAFMTRNTWLLIDELDVHLHPRWERELTYALKDLVREYPDQLTVIATSHSRDVIAIFNAGREEEGLRKEGLILDDEDFRGEEVSR